MTSCRRCLSYEGMNHYMNRRAVPARILRAFEIGADGVCNICKAYDAALDEERRGRELVQLMAAAAKGGAVVAFSGGKDSLSTLYIARERLGLHVTAFLFDNGFIPRPVVAQSERVCRELGVELRIGRPSASEQRAFLRIVETARAEDAPPCDTCSDMITRELARVVDDVEATAVLLGTNYWIQWGEQLHAVAVRTTRSGRSVLFANLPFAARVTHADVLKNVKALHADVLAMPGLSSNCRVPALVQKRLGVDIGHVPELEDLSLEVMVGHRTRASALDELLKKAPEQAAFLQGVISSSAKRSAASTVRPSKRARRAPPSPAAHR